MSSCRVAQGDRTSQLRTQVRTIANALGAPPLLDEFATPFLAVLVGRKVYVHRGRTWLGSSWCYRHRGMMAFQSSNEWARVSPRDAGELKTHGALCFLEAMLATRERKLAARRDRDGPAGFGRATARGACGGVSRTEPRRTDSQVRGYRMVT